MKRSKLMKLLALVLALSMVLPVLGHAQPTEEAGAWSYSHILDHYAYVSAKGGGKISAGFWVYGKGVKTDIGAETVQIYESTDGTNWTWKKSFRYIDMPELMGHNVGYYDYILDYQGVAGRYYKAHVTLLARDADGQETRIYFTEQIRAT